MSVTVTVKLQLFELPLASVARSEEVVAERFRSLLNVLMPLKVLLFESSVDDAAAIVMEPPAVMAVLLTVARVPVSRFVPIVEDAIACFHLRHDIGHKFGLEFSSQWHSEAEWSRMPMRHDNDHRFGLSCGDQIIEYELRPALAGPASLILPHAVQQDQYRVTACHIVVITRRGVDEHPAPLSRAPGAVPLLAHLAVGNVLECIEIDTGFRNFHATALLRPSGWNPSR